MKETFWPTPLQELLLKASFLPPNQAIEAWSKWAAQIDLDQIDPGSQRLLPLLYTNLKQFSLQDPLMLKIKGKYRYTWAQNHRLFHAVRPLLAAFQNQSIPLLALKGAALLLTQYEHFGLRPMEDFDLLVPQNRALQATEILEQFNWTRAQLKFQAFKQFTPFFFQVYCSCPFENRESFALDLHWRLLRFADRASQAAEPSFWEGSKEVHWEGISIRVPHPADQLLHTCFHGAAYNEVPTFRWVGDAAILLKNHTPFDWYRVEKLSRQHQISLPIRETLAYLKKLLQIEVPNSILQMSAPSSEQAAYEKRKKAPPASLKQKWIGNIKHLRSWHRELSSRVSFVQFLLAYWGVKTKLELLRHLIQFQIRFWNRSTQRR